MALKTEELEYKNPEKESKEIKDMESKESKDCCSLFLHTRLQTHVWHLQTKSYVEHKALGKLYEALDIIDDYIEVYLSRCSFKISQSSYVDYESKENIISFYKNLLESIEPTEYSELNNIQDEIKKSISQTIYLLNLC